MSEHRLQMATDSSRTSPTSPGKRRMVDNEKGKIRLISRGLPDSDEEDQQVIITNPPALSTSPAKEPLHQQQNRALNLSSGSSRKRKTIEPSTGEQAVLVLPSPTTQIARQIDSIRLAGTPTPVYGSYNARVPMLGSDPSLVGTSLGGGYHQQDSQAGVSMGVIGNMSSSSSRSSSVASSLPVDHPPRPQQHTAIATQYHQYHHHHQQQQQTTVVDDSSSTILNQRTNDRDTTSSSSPSSLSPYRVSPVGTLDNMEDTTLAMERRLQRPHNALGMKRTMPDDSDNEEEGECGMNDGGEVDMEKDKEERGMAAAGGREDNGGDTATGNKDDQSLSGRREKMTKYSHVSSRSNSQTPPIRVPTIVRSMSLSPTAALSSSLSPPKDTKHSLITPTAHLPSATTSGGSSSDISTGYLIVPVALSTQAVAGTTTLPLPVVSSTAPYTTIPSSFPSSSIITPVPPSSSSSSSSSSVPSSQAPQQQQQQPSKISNFSISELLSKDNNRSKSPKPQPSVTQTFPAIPPSFLTLYYQQWYMQMLSNMKKFQGEASEADSRMVRTVPIGGTSSPLVVVSDTKEKTGDGRTESPSGNSSIHSPTNNEAQSPASLVSHSSSSHSSTNPERESQVGGSTGEGDSGSQSSSLANRLFPTTNGAIDLTTQKDEGGEKRVDQRQNALLQVSEAHLAILPDEDGDTPLHLSIIQENIPLTFYLVRLISGVRMNLDIANNMRQTPLHLSVITRQPMLTHLLVQNGASVNFPDRRGNTCIHLAAQRKNIDALQILSQATNPIPDFNCRNFAGLTPVHLATKEGSIDVLKFLFQMGANKNCADSCSGRTPLHYAVESQNFQMCNFLLESGCNVNAITFSGNTPLHVAAGRRLKEIVAVLMAYGANPAIANGEGDFPSDLPASLLMQRAKMNTR